MADVNISKYRASVVRDGSKPASPGFVVSEGQDPVNPPGTNNFVPYTGATANVELGEFGLESGFVTLDTTPTNIPTDQGAIYWDDAKSTAALIMNGTTQHIGQDTFFYVKNSSGSSIPKGTAVRFAGTDGASGHILIAPFLADGTYPSSYFMGVTAETIANGSFGQVMHFGELNGIDTSGYTAGDLLYASSTVAGGFQTTAPVAPNNIVLIAAAVNSKNNGEIIVRPQIGSNINNDEGVKITSVADKNLLQYQSGTGLWENKNLAQVLGGTSSQFVKGNGSLDSTSYQPLLTNPVTGTGTTNNLSKFTGASTIGNSTITDNGTTVSILNSSFTDVLRVGSSLNSLYFYADSGSVNIMTGAGFSGSGITFAGVSNYLDFNTNSLTRMRLTTAGNLVLGPNPFSDSGIRLQVTGSISFRASASGSAATQIPIFIADPSGATRELLTRTPAQLLNDIGGQAALTNPVTGTGTTNYLPKFTGSTTIGNSQVFDNGTNVGIGTASPTEKLDVIGVFRNLMPSDPLSGMITAKILSYSPSPYGIHFRGYDSGVHSIQVQREGNNSQLFGLSLQPLGGNLLVGTTTDNGARLQVSGSISSGFANTSALLVQSNGTATTGAAIAIQQRTGEGDTIIFADYEPFAEYGIIARNSIDSIDFTGGTTSGSLDNYNITNRSGNIRTAYVKARIGLGSGVSLFGGNVGIGTSSPLTRLMVQDSANTYVAHFSGLNQANGIAIGTNSSNVAVIQGYTRTFSATNNIAMQVDGGNVGIGTFSPSAPLHIVTPTGVNFQNAIRFEKAGGYGEVNLENYYTSGSNYGFGIDVAGTTMMVVNNLGNVGIGTTSPLQKFHITQASDTSYPTLGTGKGALFIAGDTNLYGLYVGINTLDGNTYFQAMRNNSATAYNITMQAAGGNLLIGTTTDNSHKLRVNGTGYFDTGIKTGNPVGSTTNDWLLGRALVSGTSTPDRWIRVQIGNLYYDILAVYMGSV